MRLVVLLLLSVDHVRAGSSISLCFNSCSYGTDNGVCSDGGPGSDYSSCTLGSDCADCGTRVDDGSSGGTGSYSTTTTTTSTTGMSIILPICGCLLAALFVVIILKKKPQAAAALVEATPGLIEMKKGSDSAAPAGEV